MMAWIWVRTGRNPDRLRGALSCDVATGGVPLDDAEDQTHGRAVGQCHPLACCQAEPNQAPEEEGEPTFVCAVGRQKAGTHRAGLHAGFQVSLWWRLAAKFAHFRLRLLYLCLVHFVFMLLHQGDF